MINGIAAIVAYLNSISEIQTMLTSTAQAGTVNIFSTRTGTPPDSLITDNQVIEKTLTLQRISDRPRVVGDPREVWRLRLRAYANDSLASFNLLKDVHNKAFLEADGVYPIRNRLINGGSAGKWFLFAIDAVGDGPFTTVEEPIKTDVTISSYDFTFSSVMYP